MPKEIKDKVISFRVSEADFKIIEQYELEGESPNQTATRLFKEKVLGIHSHTDVNVPVDSENTNGLVNAITASEQLKELVQTIVYDCIRLHEDTLSDHENTIQFLKTEIDFLKQKKQAPKRRPDASGRLPEADMQTMPQATDLPMTNEQAKRNRTDRKNRN